LRSRISKPLVPLGPCPIIIHCLRTLSRHPLIRDIVVVASNANRRAVAGLLGRYRIAKVRAVVLGGARRQDSVRRGLRAMHPRTQYVLIHDSARPFIDTRVVSRTIRRARRTGAAITGLPVKATIKVAGSCRRKRGLPPAITVRSTLKRDTLWEIQTPQVFRAGLIRQAYRRCGNVRATDDSMLVEKLGARVSVVPGSYRTIKITTPEDLLIARALLNERPQR